MRHSMLRNIIERAYGVIKKRFPTLGKMSSYPFHIQVDIVMSCFFLHNFVRRNQLYHDLFDILDDDDLHIDDDDLNAPDFDDYVEDPATHAQTVAWRDDIAQRMWDAYLVEVAARGLAPAPP